jgi:hypothetical protein
MQSLTSHYHQLLGLSSNGKVENVHVSMSGKRVEIRLVCTGKQVALLVLVTRRHYDCFLNKGCLL